MDRDLVTRAQHGDGAAFDAIAAALLDRLYRIAYLMLREPEAAEDAVQEALVRAWRDLPSLRDPERLEAWMRSLVVHACYDEARRIRRRAPELTLVSGRDAEQVDPLRGLAEREILNRAFRRLSIEHRATVVLRHYLELTLPEIAATLRIPLGTAKSRLHHGERALRAAVEADDRTAGGIAG